MDKELKVEVKYESVSEFEAALKERYELNSDKTGIPLVEEIISIFDEVDMAYEALQEEVKRLKEEVGKLKMNDPKFTPEEIAAKTYMEWSDESIAKMVRKSAKHLATKRVDGYESVASLAASLILCGLCKDANIGKLIQTLSHIVNDTKEESYWKVTVQRVNSMKGDKIKIDTAK